MKRILVLLLSALLLMNTLSPVVMAEEEDAVQEQQVADQDRFTENFVTRLYSLCLNRAPDAGGLSHWKEVLINHTQSGADVAYGFIFSPEFQSKSVSDDAYIKILYKAFFDRDPDASGYQTWANWLGKGISRYYVLCGFTNSVEFDNLCNTFSITRGTLQRTEPADLYPDVAAFVIRFYQQCLGRSPERSGLNFWVEQLTGGQQKGADVAYGFIFSPEFVGKNIPNDVYVNTLYRAFFDREPDVTGFNTWIGQLIRGVSRRNVLCGFIGSAEFANLCARYGIQVGGLSPDASVARTGSTVTSGYDDVMAQDVFVIMNQERVKAGVAPLRWSVTAEGWAKIRAAELITLFSHTRPDGTQWNTAGTAWYNGENLAYGLTTSESVMAAWMSSSGHKTNILRPQFMSVGVACYTYQGNYYWVQSFSVGTP